MTNDDTPETEAQPKKAANNARTSLPPVKRLQQETQKLNQAVGIMNAGKELAGDDLRDASIEAFEEQLDKIREVFEEEFRDVEQE